MNKLVRAVIYTRVSTVGQAEDGVSLEVQLDLARKYCEERGWMLGEVYTDVMSGRSNKRPHLKRLEADAKDRRFDVVLVYKLDRLARSASTFYRLASLFRSNDVTLASLTEDLDLSTAGGKAMVGILAVFAEIFSDQLSERVRSAMRATAAKGKLAGGIVPLGYRRVDGKYEVIPEEAQVVSEAFRIFLTAKSLRGSVDQLNTLGLRTKTGRMFHGPGLKVILQNPVYCGMLAYGKNQIITSETGKRKKWLPRDQWVTVEDVHPAIVSREDWEQAQRILEEGSGKHSRIKYGQGRYAWSGLIRCQACGEICTRYGSNPRTLNGKPYHSPSYVCRTFTVRGKAACEGYAYVSDAFLRLRAIPALTELLGQAPERAKAKKKVARPRVDHRARRLTELQGKRDREKELFRAGYSSFEEMAANIKRIEAQIAELSRDEPQEIKAMALPGNFLAIWGELTEAGKGEVLRGILDHCEASKTTFTFYFKPIAGLPDSHTIPRDNVRGPRSK